MVLYQTELYTHWSIEEDLNLRHMPYQDTALTRLSYRSLLASVAFLAHAGPKVGMGRSNSFPPLKPQAGIL